MAVGLFVMVEFMMILRQIFVDNYFDITFTANAQLFLKNKSIGIQCTILGYVL